MVLDRSDTMSLLIRAALSNKLMRKLALSQFEKSLYKKLVVDRDPMLTSPLYSKKANEERYDNLVSMVRSLMRGLNKGVISKDYARKMLNNLVSSAMLGGGGRQEALDKYKAKYGISAPSFFTLSPTKQCNLNCKGCYASSLSNSTEKLEWDVVEKIIKEMYEELGMRFFTISGGEPLMYRSQGKTIMDLFKKYNDCFFLMYTNGSLITDEIAKQMAELGNITPAISVEGFKKETDARRGEGMHEKVLAAMALLRKHGVMFGISVTATKENIDVLVQDKFYEYYVNELGATYIWMFQYMPVGRKFSLDLMLDPHQRIKLFKQQLHIRKKMDCFIADFWNSGLLSSGCLSCAREGGYFYIDWNGNIFPCVFVNYYKDNVKDLFKKGKKVQDALFSDLFKAGREWQTKYFNNHGKAGNMLSPCFIRDHHKEFLERVTPCNPIPGDEAAKEAMESKSYHKGLIEFDEKLDKVTKPIWDSEYE